MSGRRSPTSSTPSPGARTATQSGAQSKSTRTESSILREILLYLGTRTDLRAWRSNSGAALGRRGLVRFGVPGQADISGILVGGRRLEIEVKGPTGRMSDQQRKFRAMIECFGGLYILARSVDDVTQALP